MKLLKQRHFLTTIQTILFTFSGWAQVPDLPLSKYGVPVLKTLDTYQKSILTDSNKLMLELKTNIINIKYDLRYASSNNFMKRKMYPSGTNKTWLRKPATLALKQVQDELLMKGFGLKIFDAYRPYSVTEKFWELVHDERYVADPSKGSGHNRGLAVDLTIIILATEKEIDMGTGFDNFTDTAHHSFTTLSKTVLQNRQLLKETMLKYGFQALETEWWHYYWPNNRAYEVLDLSFKQLSKKIGLNRERFFHSF